MLCSLENATLTFLRHAEASHYAEDDEQKPLSEKGRQQAFHRGLSWASETRFDLIITSSALRTVQTAQEILRALNYFPPVVQVSSLYLPPNVDEREKIEQMLITLGSISLKQYLEEDGALWARYNHIALQDVLTCIHEHAAANILIVAHGNIINSLGLSLCPNAKELLSVSFRNCEGFRYDTEEIKLI